MMTLITDVVVGGLLDGGIQVADCPGSFGVDGNRKSRFTANFPVTAGLRVVEASETRSH